MTSSDRGFDFSLSRHQGFDGQWQEVTGTGHKLFVFSAYYDPRSKRAPVVRIVGATKTKRSEQVFCRLYHKATTANGTTRARVRHTLGTIDIIRENWNLKYS